ncbi:MAG: hypothetical protein WC220_05525 [Pedobacter sp.]|jgi:hypothetical protein
MISKKQLKANQENAKLGGVKTEAGKSVSKFNAQTHGIMRQSIVESEKENFQTIFTELFEYFKPNGIIENLLVERLSIYYLKLLRTQKAESGYINGILNTSIIDFASRSKNKSRLGSENIGILCDIYSRYETTVENKFFRAFHELERIQMGSFGKNNINL